MQFLLTRSDYKDAETQKNRYLKGWGGSEQQEIGPLKLSGVALPTPSHSVATPILSLFVSFYHIILGWDFVIFLMMKAS